MADPEREASCAASSSWQSTFERDSVTWTFAKLAERTLKHLFRDASSRALYLRWLLEEAPGLRSSAPDDGLMLTQLELGDDGELSLVARPERGEFVLIVHHDEFHVLMATSYGVLTASEQQDGVCLAHFEGNPTLAVRWALGLHEVLERKWRAESAAARPALRKAAPN
jgi:hypothetical protein